MTKKKKKKLDWLNFWGVLFPFFCGSVLTLPRGATCFVLVLFFFIACSWPFLTGCAVSCGGFFRGEWAGCLVGVSGEVSVWFYMFVFLNPPIIFLTLILHNNQTHHCLCVLIAASSWCYLQFLTLTQRSGNRFTTNASFIGGSLHCFPSCPYYSLSLLFSKPHMRDLWSRSAINQPKLCMGTSYGWMIGLSCGPL